MDGGGGIPFVPRSARKLDMERTMKKFKSKLCLYGRECPYGSKVRALRRARARPPRATRRRRRCPARALPTPCARAPRPLASQCFFAHSAAELLEDKSDRPAPGNTTETVRARRRDAAVPRRYFAP